MNSESDEQSPIDDSGTDDAEMRSFIEQLPESLRACLPTNAAGDPEVQLVGALFRYDSIAPGKVHWVQLRELTEDDWDAVISAHSEVYAATHGLDCFLSFAWGDLQTARTELLRQLRENTHPHDWMAQLIEYRVLNFSTALKLYHEHVMAQLNRAGDERAQEQAKIAFSELYDESFAYRVVYTMRNILLHQVRGVLRFVMKARLIDGSDTEATSEAGAILVKTAFDASGANAAVRRQVCEADYDIDLFTFIDEAFVGVQRLHDRLTQLIYPKASQAAQLIFEYIKEVGERPRFHEYVRGLPTKGLLATTALDRVGFDYVMAQAGIRTTHGEGPLTVLPTYGSPPPPCSPATEHEGGTTSS